MHPLNPLSKFAVGAKGRIASFELPPETRQRLNEMGLTLGAECTLVRIAPLGDPIEVRVRGYHLSLRKAEAAGILLASSVEQP
jgi:Fe2+ transport system protein FeoA